MKNQKSIHLRLQLDRPGLPLLCVVLLSLMTLCTATAQTTAFTYQGQLSRNGVPANGNFDFIFSLKNSLTGGGTIGTNQTKTNVLVTNGIFTVELDHGANAFTGADRWMNLQVRPAGGGSYTNLTPRQPVRPAPYAIHAAQANSLPNVYTDGANVGIGTSNLTVPLTVRSPSGGNDNPVSIFSVRNCGAPCGQPAWTEGIRLLNTNDNGRVGIGFVVNSGADLTTVPNAYIGTTDRAFNNELQFATMNSSGELQANVIVRSDGEVDFPAPRSASGTLSISSPGGDPGLAVTPNGGGTRHALIFKDEGISLNPRGGFTEFIVLNNGNVGIGDDTPEEKLTVNGHVKCTTAVITSDRNKKSGFESVDARAVLHKVATMPITKWHYKSDTGTPHIGPMAQDFHEAFGLGVDDKHIATVDADGVALAAIKGLSQVVAEKDAKIDALNAKLESMEARFAALEKAVNATK